MATKQMEQAVALKYREAPLVQCKSEGDSTFEKVMGLFSSHVAPEAGKVVKITKDAVHIKQENGQVVQVHLYNHFPLNGGKDMMHSTPLVKVGDQVTKLQPVADSNFTKGGTLSLGTNLLVGYTLAKGRSVSGDTRVYWADEDGAILPQFAA